ncbi:MAG TPA: biotin/lipoyl-binding protein, partial [Chroococcidiopsis sp.]
MQSPASIQSPSSAPTPARRFGFRLKPWAIAITAVGVAGAAVVIANFLPLRSSSQINLASDRASDTVVVQYGTLPIQIRANGSVQPVRTINLSPKEDGRIVELLVREGDRIAAGQLIARMDDQQIQAQVAQYRAALARSQAELAERLAGNRPEDIAKAEAELARSQSQWQEGRSQLELATARLTRRQFLAA